MSLNARYTSLFVALAFACNDGEGPVVNEPNDLGPDAGSDLGPPDGSPGDLGADGWSPEVGPVDSGVADDCPNDGPNDGGSTEGGPFDGGPADGGQVDGGQVDGGPVEIEGSMFGLAMSADGAPVFGARFSGATGLTDPNGMMYGDADVGGGGFVQVAAPGFAPGFARRIATFGDWEWFEVSLTPVGAARVFAEGDTRAFLVGDADAPRASMVLSSAALEQPDAVVELTVVDPLDVGPLLAPLGDGSDLYLTAAFALTAHDQEGVAVGLAPGAEATVHLAGDFGPRRVFAEFDPGAGSWSPLAANCVVAGDGIDCTVDHTSPLFGVFDVTPPPFWVARADGLRATGFDDDPSDAEYKAARARFDRAWGAWQEEGGAMPAPDNVTAALHGLVNAARAQAGGSLPEAGKTRLGGAVDAALMTGDQALADQLVGEMREIADGIADELLNSSNCARLKEYLLAAQQCELLGSDKGQQLLQKARELFSQCTVWVGHISITMKQGDTFADLDDFTTVSNPDWTEHHGVRIGINPDTKVATGENIVSISLGKCSFQAEDESCCGPPYTIEIWGAGGGSHLLSLGTFDFETNGWAFNPPQPHARSGSVSLSRRDVVTIEMDDDPCTCRTVQDFTATITEEYTSVMVHGFQGVPISPTLAEMLNNGSRTFDRDGQQLTSRGFEEVQLDLQEGLFALTGQAWVSWSLIRDTW